MNKTIGNDKLSELLNPRKNMSSKFRSLLFDKILEYCTTENTLNFFDLINSRVKKGCFLYNFIENFSKVEQRISDILKKDKWQELERNEILDIFRKSNSMKENETYILLLAIDLSTFIINGGWIYSEVDIESQYSHMLVFASELNMRLCDKNVSFSSIVNDVKPLISFYRKERLLEYFLSHFNAIEWYITVTIRLSREFLRYSRINSKHIWIKNITEKSHIDSADLIVMQDEMLAMLISRIRELIMNRTDERHSSAFSYIIKITTLVDPKFKKNHFTEKLESILDYYKDELKIFSIKRNKENFHITTYSPTIVFKENTIQSETTVNIPKVYEILDAFVDVYENYRQIMIGKLGLSRPDLPKRVMIKKAKLGDLYLKYTYR